jgi:hypothetical protein
MWQLGLSVGLPIFAAKKQDRALDESRQRAAAETAQAQALRQVLALRVHQRADAAAALGEVLRQYRGGLLVLSAATAESTLLQYVSGRIPMAAVLEALLGTAADRAGALDALAQLQAIAISQREVSLDPVVGLGGGTPAGAMPGTAAMGRAGASEQTTPASGAAESAAPRMNGM